MGFSGSSPAPALPSAKAQEAMEEGTPAQQQQQNMQRFRFIQLSSYNHTLHL